MSESGEITRTSDSEIIKGEFSKPLNIGVINFDIDRDSDLLDFIRSHKITGARFETRNGSLRKEDLVINFDGVNEEVLLSSLDYQEPEEEDVIFEEVVTDEIRSEEE